MKITLADKEEAMHKTHQLYYLFSTTFITFIYLHLFSVNHTKEDI